MVEPGLTTSIFLITSRFERFDWLSRSSVAEFGSNRKRMSFESSRFVSSVPGPPVRIGEIATFWSLNWPVPSMALSAARLAKRSASGGILDQVGPVGEHRRLVDAAEAAGRIDGAGEEGEVLGQVREVDLGQLLAGVVACPLERLGDRVEVRVAVVAHHAVAFEHALREPLDDLRVGLGEAAVQHHHVGDDEQVLVGDEDLGDAAALLDDLADGRLPGHRTGDLVAPDLMSCRNSSPAWPPSSV